ncbi:MAG: hypothetical protein LCH99_01920 [Proteobacteria bacterium]|nr:hypothetical protein [Pseudomonadota bacterium]
MSAKTFIWKGPPTAVDIWQETKGETAKEPTLIFSGQLATGQAIPKPLDPAHSLVASWLAFKLIEETAGSAAVAEAAIPRADKRISKESIDG